jgi:hypothetical protein
MKVNHRQADGKTSSERLLAAASAADLVAGSDDDRAWFERHHSRSYRIRPPIGGERPLAPKRRGFKPMVLVRQLEPGQRGRIPFAWRKGEPLLNSERTGEELFLAIMTDANVTILERTTRP